MEFYQHPSLRKLMRLLNGTARASAPKAMFVGGCVRDYALDLPIKDIDVATVHTPQMVMTLLKPEFKIVPVGIEHGTVIAVTPVGPVQITTLRHDVETDGRHARVSFTDNWAEDAMRRDFTINTLLMDINGTICDPLGQAVPDLERSKVRFVGEAAARVREDVLRILRYVRFHCRFGHGAMDKHYLGVFAKEKALFKKLSRERVTEEIVKIISFADAFKHLQKFEDTKLLPLPKLSNGALKHFKILNDLNLNQSSLAFALWADGSKAKWKKIKSYLKLPNNLCRDVEQILDGRKLIKSFDKQHYLLALYRYDRDAARRILIIALLRNGYSASSITSTLRQFDKLPKPIFPITGKDLIAQGYSSGPALGRMLQMLEKKWIKSGFKSVSPSVSSGAAPRKAPSRPTSRR